MPKARTGAISEPLTKTQLLSLLAAETGMTRREVGAVMDELSRIVGRHLRRRGGAGQFTLPGLLKIKTLRKPATRARKGKNPFTGEGDDVQGQAGADGGEDPAAQGPEGDGQLRGEAGRLWMTLPVPEAPAGSFRREGRWGFRCCAAIR